MKIRIFPMGRNLLIIAALLFGSACILEAAAGPTPTPKVIVVPGDDGAGSGESTAPSPTPETPLSPIPTGTFAAPPTATATIAQVTMTAGQDLSCVTGPHWILYEWVARIEEGETVILLARAAPEWGEYYYVLKSSGESVSCWVFGGSSTIHGDPSTLPVREAPPLPEITLTIRNSTYLQVTYLRIRPQAETVWGTNLLAAHPVAAQETYGLTITAGFYDIRLMDQRNGILYEANDVPIGAEPSSNTIVLSGQYTVIVRNETANTMCRGEVVTLDDSFHADLSIPGDGRISPGEEAAVTGPAGVFVMRFYQCGSGELMFVVSDAYIGPATATYVAH